MFRYFPEQPLPLHPVGAETVGKAGGSAASPSRRSKDSAPGPSTRFPPSIPGARLPAILLVDHRKGIPVWGNEQPLERNQWGDRAVLIVETLDRGSRALEQNLRSFSDDDRYIT